MRAQIMARGSRILTDLVIRQTRPPERGQVEVWDAQVRGLALLVSEGGTKSFIVMYYAGGRRRRLTLGRYPDLTLTMARAKAHSALQMVALGGDPARDKSVARREIMETGFATLVAEFIAKYARPRNRDWRETERILEREFCSRWGTISIGDISKGDVVRAIDAIVARGSPGSASRSFAILRRYFNWCAERGLVEFSPCQGLRAPTAPIARERVLSDAELASVWRCAERLGYPYGKAVQVLILTAQRKSEVIACQWTEFDLASSTWTIAAERNKSKRTHLIPLPKLMIELLTSMPRLHDLWLFPTATNVGPISGFSKWKAQLDAGSGVSNWRLHDLRRTAATGLASLGVGPHVIERILNHSSGTFGGVAGIYNRFQYFPEMREGLDRWSAHVAELVRRPLT